MSEIPPLKEVGKAKSKISEQDAAVGSKSTIGSKVKSTDQQDSTDQFSPLEDHPRSSLSVGVPNAVKFGLPALFMGLLVVVYLISHNVLIGITEENGSGLALSGKRAVVDPAVNRHAMEPDVVEADSLFMPEVIGGSGESTMQRLAEGEFKFPSGFVSEALNERLHTIEQTIANNTEKLEAIELNLTRLPGVDELESVQANVDGSLVWLKVQITALQQQVSGHSALIQKTGGHKAQEQQAYTPPFSLLSVDQWGGQHCAVLLMEGKESFAYLGDVRAGWSIKDFVSSSRIRVCKQGSQYCTELLAPGV